MSALSRLVVYVLHDMKQCASCRALCIVCMRNLLSDNHCIPEGVIWIRNSLLTYLKRAASRINDWINKTVLEEYYSKSQTVQCFNPFAKRNSRRNMKEFNGMKLLKYFLTFLLLVMVFLLGSMMSMDGTVSNGSDEIKVLPRVQPDGKNEQKAANRDKNEPKVKSVQETLRKTPIKTDVINRVKEVTVASTKQSALQHEISSQNKSAILTPAYLEGEQPFPPATRVCTHAERIRHLEDYCRGPGHALAQQYKDDLKNKFMSTVVSI